MKLPTKKSLPLYYALLCLFLAFMAFFSDGGWTPISVYSVASLYFGDKLLERNE